MLDRTQLYWRVADALAEADVPVYCLSHGNPYDINAGHLRLRVHISNVHDADRSDPDEARIQCRGSLPGLMRKGLTQGRQPVVLGYDADSQVFCAWDPTRLASRGKEAGIFSLYTRWSIIHQAAKSGLGVYIDNNNQRVIAFDEAALYGYCSAAGVTHKSLKASQAQSLFALLVSAKGNDEEVPQSGTGAIASVRKKVQRVTSGFPRDPLFPRRVLPAYGWKCAICGVQLGLVDAAHIVPHGHPQGISEVRNGVALCKLHHAAYDSSLIYIGDDYRVGLNKSRVSVLKKRDRHAGLALIAKYQSTQIKLPAKTAHRPDKKLIRLANEIRFSTGVPAGGDE